MERLRICFSRKVIWTYNCWDRTLKATDFCKYHNDSGSKMVLFHKRECCLNISRLTNGFTNGTKEENITCLAKHSSLEWTCSFVSQVGREVVEILYFWMKNCSGGCTFKDFKGILGWMKTLWICNFWKVLSTDTCQSSIWMVAFMKSISTRG